MFDPEMALIRYREKLIRVLAKCKYRTQFNSTDVLVMLLERISKHVQHKVWIITAKWIPKYFKVTIDNGHNVYKR